MLGKRKRAEVDAEAARRALDVAGQLMGTNPALVERAERERDRSREAAAFFLDMAAPTDAEKQDLLVRAAFEGREGAVEWLLSAGVDPDAVGSEALEEHDLDRRSALIACVEGGHVPVLELLLGAGADVNKAGPWWAGPLLTASDFEQAACVERLLQEGANVNAQNEFGNTALHYAANLGNENIVNTLLDAGADRTLTTNNGRTALQIARDCGLSRIVALLQE